MLFNLVFANNNIIDLHFLIAAPIAQIFNPIAELVISIGIPNKKVKVEIEIQSVIVSSCANLFVLSTHQFILCCFLKKIIFCFIYGFNQNYWLTFPSTIILNYLYIFN